MSKDCLFCKIVDKEASADIVYEDTDVVAFKDIDPAAPVHLLIVPRKHIDSHISLPAGDADMMGKLHVVANDLARAFHIDKSGYRLVINCGDDAGQAVYHLHMHLIGGKSLQHNLANARGV